ncbi:MAG: hypothetical protein JSU90_02185 [Nitrospiraceae bacterium]|nr:MAG: hypothetical protein JSU90_02185 [Nitrospiraceae bacterium]
MMKCSFCGHEFDENRALGGCTSCGLLKKCDLIKCPNCSFEMVPEPKWIKKLREIRRK